MPPTRQRDDRSTSRLVFRFEKHDRLALVGGVRGETGTDTVDMGAPGQRVIWPRNDKARGRRSRPGVHVSARCVASRNKQKRETMDRLLWRIEVEMRIAQVVREFGSWSPLCSFEHEFPKWRNAATFTIRCLWNPLRERNLLCGSRKIVNIMTRSR